jgi:oligopeptide transport system substrate-binding protein
MKPLFIYSILFFLASCNSSNTPRENKRYGGNLQIEIPYNPITLFPPSVDDDVSERVIYQMHMGLLRFNPSNATIQSGIAKNWDVDNTGKVYVFYLDSTVYFHNDDCFIGGRGRRVTAHDFKYTFTYLASRRAENKNFGIVSRIKGAKEYFLNYPHESDVDIEGIQVVDDFTLKLEFESAASIILFHLAKPAASVLAHEAISRYGALNLVGTGPFICKKTQNQDAVILEKNEFFFKKNSKKAPLPYLDSITFRFVDSKQERCDLFLQKKLDAMLYIKSEDINEITELLYDNLEYVLKESFQTTDAKQKFYNIISKDIQNLYTNNLRLYDMSEVYRETSTQ